MTRGVRLQPRKDLADVCYSRLCWIDPAGQFDTDVDAGYGKDLDGAFQGELEHSFRSNLITLEVL